MIFLLYRLYQEVNHNHNLNPNHHHNNNRFSLSSSLVVLLLLLFILGPSEVSGARVSPSRSSLESCPSGPLCEAPRSVLYYRYCNTYTASLLSLFSSVKRLTKKVTSTKPKRKGKLSQATPIRFSHYPLQLPFYSDEKVRERALHQVEEYLKLYLAGQDHILPTLRSLLYQKIHFPSTPLVIHLAGDNGVGKTFTARLISLSLSLYCSESVDSHGGGGAACGSGDALLVIPCSSLRTLPLADARHIIISQLVDFIQDHPHGVVLLDDLSTLQPELIRELGPLFGRGPFFPEQYTSSSSSSSSSAHGNNNNNNNNNKEKENGMGNRKEYAQLGPSLANLIVILTTDFGKQGMTRGKTVSEIQSIIDKDFASLYGNLLTAHIHTLVYLPFEESTAVEMIQKKIVRLSCPTEQAALSISFFNPQDKDNEPQQQQENDKSSSLSLKHYLSLLRIESSWIEEEAALLLVKQHQHLWEGTENGRSIEKNILQPLVGRLWEEGVRQLFFSSQHQPVEEEENTNERKKKGLLSSSSSSTTKHGRGKGNIDLAHIFSKMELLFYVDEPSATVRLSINGIKVTELVDERKRAKQHQNNNNNNNNNNNGLNEGEEDADL